MFIQPIEQKAQSDEQKVIHFKEVLKMNILLGLANYSAEKKVSIRRLVDPSIPVHSFEEDKQKMVIHFLFMRNDDVIQVKLMQRDGKYEEKE